MNPSKFDEILSTHAELRRKVSECEKTKGKGVLTWLQCREDTRSLEKSATLIGQEVYENRMSDPDNKVFSQRRFDPIFFSHLAFTACNRSSRPMSNGISGNGHGTVDFGGDLDCRALKGEMTKWVNAFVEKETLGR